MPDNPQTPQTSWFALPEHQVVAISGRDAVAFAHAQTMNDVGALQDGQWQWNGWLTAKGRVIALFAVIRIDSDTLWLLLPDADADAFVAQLRRFVFRSKVAIRVRDDVAVIGRLQASALASGNHWVGDSADVIELDLSGELGNGQLGRSLRIGAAITASVDATACETWRRADLEHGWPRLDAAQSGQWTPQQLSLDRLRAYSVKKGCYPGQEIVARTHFLGQAKRGLALIASPVRLHAGAELTSGDAVLGTVVSACAQTALALLPIDFQPQSVDSKSIDTGRSQTDEGPALGGALWSVRPLRGGLAR